MGNYSKSEYNINQSEALISLFKKANYKVLYPKRINSLCCGMPFSSKGFIKEAEYKANELYNELFIVSKEGKIPIVFDTTPCVKTFKKFLKSKNLNSIKVFDSIEFIHDELFENLVIKQKKDTIAIHNTCSGSKMELNDKLFEIANRCVENVVVPEDVNCCGFAGDRGFTYPELNSSALEELKPQIKSNNCTKGFSTSRTCEIGLSLNSGIEYNSIIQLVNECSEEKK